MNSQKKKLIVCFTFILVVFVASTAVFLVATNPLMTTDYDDVVAVELYSAYPDIDTFYVCQENETEKILNILRQSTVSLFQTDKMKDYIGLGENRFRLIKSNGEILEFFTKANYILVNDKEYELDENTINKLSKIYGEKYRLYHPFYSSELNN